MHSVIDTQNDRDTLALAEAIGRNLKGGETIELVSDVGGGKTTFTRGLVKGAGSKDHVSSPTFTISNLYQTPRFAICHFDFYRLPEAGIIEHQLHDTVDMNKDVTVVEWSDVVKHVLPDERVTIHIAPRGDTARRFTIDGSKSLDYLLKNVDTHHTNR